MGVTEVGVMYIRNRFPEFPPTQRVAHRQLRNLWLFYETTVLVLVTKLC